MKQMVFWNSLAFSMFQWMLAIWSLVPLPFLKPAWTSGSSRFTYYWNLTWRILRITLLVCEMSAIVWQFEHSLALPFLGNGMKIDLFQSCGHCWVFQICWHIECSTFTASSFRIWNSSTGIPSPLHLIKTERAPQMVLVVKNLPDIAGDGDLISDLGRYPGGGHGNPLQYSSLENPTDREAWWATVHGVTKIGHDLVTKQQ